VRRINEDVLHVGTRGKRRIERRMVTIAAPLHFRHERLVSQIERLQPAFPPARLRMPAVAGQPSGQNIPQAMQLAMLAEQMAAAQQARIDVPDPHPCPSTSFSVSVQVAILVRSLYSDGFSSCGTIPPLSDSAGGGSTLVF